MAVVQASVKPRVRILQTRYRLLVGGRRRSRLRGFDISTELINTRLNDQIGTENTLDDLDVAVSLATLLFHRGNLGFGLRFACPVNIQMGHYD